MQKTLGPQPEFSGQIKPQILTDPNTMSVELTIPFVNSDGSGQYVEKLTFERASTEFSSYMLTLFGRIETLQKVTFIAPQAFSAYLINSLVVSSVWK